MVPPPYHRLENLSRGCFDFLRFSFILLIQQRRLTPLARLISGSHSLAEAYSPLRIPQARTAFLMIFFASVGHVNRRVRACGVTGHPDQNRQQDGGNRFLAF
jgi:hypothetical protein